MAKILAFAGSNSSTSINFEFVKYTASLVVKPSVQILNLADYTFPMYSEDLEKEKGFSSSLVAVNTYLSTSDGVILSVNEHNSNPSAYFKNILDWLSRLERDCFAGKKIFLMSTSPGKRGAIGALTVCKQLLVRLGGDVVSTFSLPEFHTNYKTDNGIVVKDLELAHKEALKQFIDKIS